MDSSRPPWQHKHHSHPSTSSGRKQTWTFAKHPRNEAEGGTLYSVIQYTAFVEIRLTQGVTPTKYRYTGQLAQAELGLDYYVARWYDPVLGHFTQADTKVPEPGKASSWDRYSYSNNNPLKFTDPSGHNPVIIFALMIISALILTSDTPQEPIYKNFPINSFKEDKEEAVNCSGSLANCFGDQIGLKDFAANGKENPIPLDEFNEFTDKTANDLATHDVDWPGLEGGRGQYDTPFYNGGQSERRTGDPNSVKGIYDANQQVCIETIRCSGRSDINYIAQGMWGARSGEPKLVSELIARTWKFVEYEGQTPSEDTLFWLDYGYDYYKKWEKKHKKLDQDEEE